ncbi:MAG: molybdenum cofactor guanylyltransferase MobA [Campylobacterota bacterium]|nr:molybdenum cofactor guanylyltransferase MobA [Campylobacterota bacterium]
MTDNLKSKRTAIIFAGGKSSRMGRDKSLMPFGGYTTLSEYQYQRLCKFFEKVYMSTKEEKFNFEAMLIRDIYPESSPLVGLISIFETIPEDECFILSVDAPFVNEEVIEKLYKESTDPALDAIIAQSPGGTQPLCGIYRRSIIPLAKEFINKNNHKLNALLRLSKSHFVNFPNEDPFVNLNHPHEYQAAVKLILD